MPPQELKLHSRDEVFDTFLKLHPKLKEKFFLNTKEEDADPYESSQFTALIANHAAASSACTRTARCSSSTASGASAPAALRARRDVRRLTTGAKTARELAELGVRAGCEFDKNSAGADSASTPSN